MLAIENNPTPIDRKYTVPPTQLTPLSPRSGITNQINAVDPRGISGGPFLPDNIQIPDNYHHRKA